MWNLQQKAAVDWITQIDWQLAITLTFYRDFTEHRARKNMRRLWNAVDRNLYGHVVERKGRRAQRVCTFEKGVSGAHYHYHIATNPPNDIDISFNQYKLLLDKEWNKLSSAGYIKNFQSIYDNKGWAKYITKEITTINTDVIDEVTTHLN